MLGRNHLVAISFVLILSQRQQIRFPETAGAHVDRTLVTGSIQNSVLNPRCCINHLFTALLNSSTNHQFLHSKNSRNSTHSRSLCKVSASYCNMTSRPPLSLALGGSMKHLPSGLPSGSPTVARKASLQPNAGPKSMWLNFVPFRHTMSMSGPGQRSTFQVNDVDVGSWLMRPTRRRTAVLSTAARACLTRAAAEDREA